MLFSVDDDNKIIFGWSAKCACTYIINMYWYLRTNNIENTIHTKIDVNDLPSDIKNYTTIIFIRNPYKRVVSGFLDKYKKNGQYRYMWKYPTVKFSEFVDALINKDWNMVDCYHFTPQTGGHFNERILNSKVIKFFDIEKIDYSYIEKIYNKNIPESVKNKKTNHHRCFYVKEDKICDKYVYDLNIDEILDWNIDVKYFYNEDIKNKIFEFYKNDFMFFKKIGVDYTNYLEF